MGEELLYKGVGASEAGSFSIAKRKRLQRSLRQGRWRRRNRVLYESGLPGNGECPSVALKPQKATQDEVTVQALFRTSDCRAHLTHGSGPTTRIVARS